ncbi:hypothetical protein LWI29_003767 [Acer saccharum]|uniref:UBN2 domain-containing protein n=1 Tax=Acer saccharum TaxID=4024 RepID=A0AA39VW42_ACESA|nr:hypothetical protein LWI29_003767 [Acer saccharum]
MKTLLLAEGLWSIVDKGFSEPADGVELSDEQKRVLETNRINDAKALSKIQNAVSHAIFPRIMGATKAKEAWEILQQEFQGSIKEIAIKLQNLRREFENLKMKDSESMKDYFSRVIDVVNHIKTYGENITDQRIVEKILISLPEKYEYIVAAIEESKYLSSLSMHN